MVKKESDKDLDTNPFDDVRHSTYEEKTIQKAIYH